MTPLETPCREWQGARTNRGYGVIQREKRQVYLHRWVWKLMHGPIPDGMCVLHRCDNPPCFRLDHLFLGSHQDNADDKVNKGRARGGHPRLTHCKRGHAFDAANTHIRTSDGAQICLACKEARRGEKS